SVRKYRRYLKQSSRAEIKPPAGCDSSFAVLTRVSKLPVYYRDGEAGLGAYISQEIAYPQVARDASVEGTVLLEFVVETNGFITEINPLNKLGGGCTEEAIRVIRKTR